MRNDLRLEYEQLHQEAEHLAGGPLDLAQRAAVYRHLYRESAENHIFPLIAAHGALWAGGHFKFGKRLANLLSWQFLLQPKRKAKCQEQLQVFLDALRDINRRVCIDTYVKFHFTRRYGTGEATAPFIPQPIREVLQWMHDSKRLGTKLNNAQKRAIFEAHFLNEQSQVVGPTLEEATAQLEWPFVRYYALRPTIRFAYFPKPVELVFTNFADQQERIANGLRAFDIAAEVGWQYVEASLERYHSLSAEFFTAPEHHFRTLRESILANA